MLLEILFLYYWIKTAGLCKIHYVAQILFFSTFYISVWGKNWDLNISLYEQWKNCNSLQIKLSKTKFGLSDDNVSEFSKLKRILLNTYNGQIKNNYIA